MKGMMLQGTSSDVGKSLLVTALCRIFARKGYNVAPFKSQNMSNNSYVTKEGNEIGRAQGIQAEAANITADVVHNPILLKPRNNMTSEIVWLGKATTNINNFYEQGIDVITQSLNQLEEQADILVIEGAGSPVEMNLLDREIVNMKVAELADVPVFLIADINRGGVFASIVGTLQLLKEKERRRVKGIIINKFYGDVSLFQEGVEWIEANTGVKVVGVIPYLPHIVIDAEDSLSVREKKVSGAHLDIAVIRLPFISNFTDIEPFFFEEDVSIRYVTHAREFGNPDAVILPGSKSTLSDMRFLEETGLAEKIRTYSGALVGICGGYQLLGEKLLDMHGKEERGGMSGIGILPMETVYEETKTVKKTIGHTMNGLQIEGYEIHYGRTEHIEALRPFLHTEDGNEGVCAENGRVVGTYIHHLFHKDEYRHEWLERLRKQKGLDSQEKVNVTMQKEKMFDLLADEVEVHLHMDYITQLVETWEGLHHES
ncbi:cobyric acid synthase [Priestia taiwanensis]|uniref:Cobyric acid synthase n=1 Tax=Priestia taiwanensis TaxID=1347902 RepID=A0A917EKL2_9BACI|nr:cobyric acid synthase [Priestia taiwanensis]MBM7361592.1 adenosylcobyric acid synthase [Priestia taiwanensis]GGE55361.1 cobyric acid synthase [Priestia taiwanensis]